MKLFPPREAAIQSDKQKAVLISEIAYLTTTKNRLQGEINQAEDEFRKRLEEQQNLYGSEKAKLQDEIRELSALLARRIDDVKEREENCDKREEALKLAEEEIAHRTELLNKTLSVGYAQSPTTTV